MYIKLTYFSYKLHISSKTNRIKQWKTKKKPYVLSENIYESLKSNQPTTQTYILLELNDSTFFFINLNVLFAF